MEDFRKIAYKTEDLRTEKVEGATLESLEYSEKIAKEKLEKLLGPEFRDFAIRMVNLGEYKKIIENKEIDTRREIYFPRGSQTFKEYLKENSENWDSTAQRQTHWDHNHHNISTYNILLDLLRSARKESTDKTEILKKFRNHIILTIPSMPKTRHGFGGAAEIIEYVKGGVKDSKAEAYFGSENIKIVRGFIKDEKYLLKDKANLRNLINAISYQGRWGGSETRQYHIALVLDDRIAENEKGDNKYSMGDDYWGLVREQTDRGAKYVLGAISLMPNKEIYKEMIDLENSSDDFAHPIFDSHGVVMWPKEK